MRSDNILQHMDMPQHAKTLGKNTIISFSGHCIATSISTCYKMFINGIPGCLPAFSLCVVIQFIRIHGAKCSVPLGRYTDMLH